MTEQHLTEFFDALSQRDTDEVRELLDIGVSPDIANPKDGRSALYQATVLNDYPTMLALLDAGANPDFVGTAGLADMVDAAPLYHAIKEDNRSAALLLLGRGASPSVGARMANAGHRLLIHGAGGKGAAPLWSKFATKALALMLDAGLAADSVLDADDPFVRKGMRGRTLLDHALTARMSLSVFELLLDRGADPGLREVDGTSFVHRASMRNRRDVLRMLVERGHDVDTPDASGKTPLFHHGDGPTFAALLDLGADIDHQDMRGNTPLQDMLTLLVGNPSAADDVSRLLGAGARVDIKNGIGMTAVEMAKHLHSDTVASVVLAAAARQQMESSIRAVRAARP